MNKFGIVEKSWMQGKYHCLIVFTKNAVYNGYIGVPKDHFLYEKTYDKPLEQLVPKENHEFNGNIMGLLGRELANDKPYLAPDLYFSAHCGFTYSGNTLTYKESKKDYWYFGFDCFHCHDGRNLDKALQLELINKDEYEMLSEFPDYGTFKDFGYVRNNILQVVKELEELDAKNC